MKGDRREQACWLEESKMKAGKGKDKSGAKPALRGMNRSRLGNFDTTHESDRNTTQIYRVWV